MNVRKLYDHELEETFLAAILRNPGSLGECLSVTTADDLMDKGEHTAIWQAFLMMFKRSYSIDPSSLLSFLQTNGMLGAKEADAYVERLTLLGGSPLNLESWTRQLLELRGFREAYMLGGDLQQMSKDTAIDMEELMQKVTHRMMSTQGSVRPSEIGGVALEMLEDLKTRRVTGTIYTGVTSGMFDYDQATGGTEPDDYIGVAARARFGKTAKALAIQRHQLMTYDDGIIPMFSLEMDEKRLARRHAASLSMVSYGKIKSGDLDDEEFIRVTAAFEILKSWRDRLLVFTPAHFPGGVNAEKICNAIKMLAMREKVLGTFVDNFNLLYAKNLDHRNENSRMFKDLTLSAKVPVWMLVQLRRSTEKENRPPQISDIKDTGQLEQDFDRVLLIDRQDIRNEQIEDRWDELGILPNIAHIDVAKNRDGETPVFKEIFHGPTMQFFPYGDPISLTQTSQNIFV